MTTVIQQKDEIPKGEERTKEKETKMKRLRKVLNKKIVVKKKKPQQANGYTVNRDNKKERIGVNRQRDRQREKDRLNAKFFCNIMCFDSPGKLLSYILTR